jgi:hypothetical protein
MRLGTVTRAQLGVLSNIQAAIARSQLVSAG